MRRLGPGMLAVVAMAVAMAVLAGCSGEAAATPSTVATTSVDLPKSYRFEPPSISVETGASVTWTNHDDFTHNVTFEGEPGLVMKPGESVTRTFSSPGTFTYLCSLHPRDMQGSVAVAGG